MQRVGVAAVVVALLPTAALVPYMRIGDPVAASIDGLDGAQANAHMASQGSLEFVVSGLATKLRAQPNDAAGWAMLARAYAVLDRTEDAVAAYRRAIALSPADAGLLADYADELATLRGGEVSTRAGSLGPPARRPDARHHRSADRCYIFRVFISMVLPISRHMQQTMPREQPAMSEIQPLITPETNVLRVTTRATTVRVVR